MTDLFFSGESSGAVSRAVAAGTVTGTEPPSPGPVAARSGFAVGDEVSLVPAGSPRPPMAAPAHAWAMLVIGVDLDPDGSGRVESFIGFWSVRDTPQPPEVGADDVVLRMTPTPTDSLAEEFGDVPGDRVDIEMLLATRGGWHIVGRWPGLGTDWPHIVGPTAAAVMGLAEMSAIAGLAWPFSSEPTESTG